MSSAHFTVSFRNSCFSQPRNPVTKLPASLLERESLEFADRIDTGRTPTRRSYVTSHEKVLNSFEPSRLAVDESYGEREHEEKEEIEKKDILQTSEEDLKNLINDDEKFLEHLQALKAENKKTLKSLERLYDITLTNSYTTQTDERAARRYREKRSSRESCEKNKRQTQKTSNLNTKILIGEKLNKSIERCNRNLLETSFHTDEEIILDKQSVKVNGVRKEDNKCVIDANGDSVEELYTSDEYDEELDKQLRVTAPESHVNILPDKDLSSFRGRSSSFDVIANMWENFSVDEYAPYAYNKSKLNDKKDWSPTITIPEPFQMTIRDESKAKHKSKRIEKIEQEKLEKRLLEEMEMQKRIRPTPVPPTTFLPLYDEITEKEEQRRSYVRDLSKKILQATEKPFSFIKREEMKKQMKRAQSMSDIRKHKKAEEKRKQFKANPFPDKLFDLTWADKLAEQEEYRKIKIKLRAEEMLASSSLPINMKTRAGTAKYFQSGEKTKRMKEGLKKRKQKSFQPQVHHTIPDFEELHRKFENELEQRKTVNPRTVCEPFDLQTEKVPQRRSNFINSMKEKGIENAQNTERGRRREQKNVVHRSRSLSWSRVSQQTPPKFSETETSKLRQERLRQSLEKTKQDEIRLGIKWNKKRKELNELRSSIAKKAIAQDPARNRKKENKEKLEMFKMADMERRREYKEYLHDISSRIKERPLLFEREAEKTARTKAQKRYEQILKEAGIGGDTLNSFLDGDVSDGENGGGSYVQEGSEKDSNESERVTNDENASDDDVSNDGSYIDSRRTPSSQNDEDYEEEDEI